MELMDFYADWCGPCQMMKPVMESFEQAHPELKITRINIDDNDELAEKFGVSTIPCLVLMKDGAEIDRLVGLQSPKKLEQLLEGA